MTCTICGAASRAKLSKNGVEIRECTRCGLAYWVPASGFRAQDIYDATYFESGGSGPGYDDYAHLEESLRRTHARRLARLPPPVPGARMLDVGAAYGFAVAEAEAAGWRAFGLERSAAAARRALHIAPGSALVGDALALPFADDSFDLLTLWDVLEHLPEPQRAVEEVARVLRPGGCLALSTGDVGSLFARLCGSHWHLYSLPEHLFFFTRQSLRELLEAHGLRVERMFTEASIYSLGYLVERAGKTLLRGRRPASRRWPGARIRLPIDLLDIVTVHASAPPAARNPDRRANRSE